MIMMMMMSSDTIKSHDKINESCDKDNVGKHCIKELITCVWLGGADDSSFIWIIWFNHKWTNYYQISIIWNINESHKKIMMLQINMW